MNEFVIRLAFIAASSLVQPNGPEHLIRGMTYAQVESAVGRPKSVSLPRPSWSSWGYDSKELCNVRLCQVKFRNGLAEDFVGIRYNYLGE